MDTTKDRQVLDMKGKLVLGDCICQNLTIKVDTRQSVFTTIIIRKGNQDNLLYSASEQEDDTYQLQNVLYCEINDWIEENIHEIIVAQELFDNPFSISIDEEEVKSISLGDIIADVKPVALCKLTDLITSELETIIDELI